MSLKSKSKFYLTVLLGSISTILIGCLSIAVFVRNEPPTVDLRPVLLAKVEYRPFILPEAIITPANVEKQYSTEPLEIIAHFKRADCDKIRNNAQVCLACNIYHESRDQSEDGQMAVANVTLNRVHSPLFPNKICEVVWQHRQFSWTWDGKPDKTYEDDAWHRAIELSFLFIKGRELNRHLVQDNTSGALWYHADYVNPIWNTTMVQTAVLGRHIFYSSKPVDTN